MLTTRKMAKKKKSAIDKIVMGAIVGAAVGSVIGSAVAPDKGKKTRKKLKSKAEDISDTVKTKNKEILAEVNEQREKRSLIGKFFNLFMGSDERSAREIPLEQYDEEQV
jgi:gas vesicle protein